MRDFYPFSFVGAIIDGDCCVITHSFGHMCGYCALKNNDIPDEWVGNYNAPGLQYLAVHGGLTYGKCKEDETILGFDCAHAGDDKNPLLSDPNHVMKLTKQMESQLKQFAGMYDWWLSCGGSKRADVLDWLRGSADHEWERGMGEMIDMLSGGPEWYK
jgi:hypothetical protein